MPALFSGILRAFTPSKSDKQSGAEYNAAYNLVSQPAGSTTVDAGGAASSNLGKAALISTSSLGVQGTDPTQRYKLLGN